MAESSCLRQPLLADRRCVSGLNDVSQPRSLTPGGRNKASRHRPCDYHPTLSPPDVPLVRFGPKNVCLGRRDAFVERSKRSTGMSTRPIVSTRKANIEFLVQTGGGRGLVRSWCGEKPSAQILTSTCRISLFRTCTSCLLQCLQTV